MNIRIVEDVDYTVGVPGVTESPGSHRKLDLFLPDTDKPAPPVVVIHGGGWFTQNRKGTRERNIATDLANAGFAAASIDYALVDLDDPEGSRGMWPAIMTDCKLAVAFLRCHANEYRLDAERVGAVGGSAGAHLSAMLGVTTVKDGFDPAPGLDCDVQAVCYLYGVCDIIRWIERSAEHRLGMDAASIMLAGSPDEVPDAYAAASPVSYLSSDTPPTLLIHGIADDTIPYTETEFFYQQMQAAGVESDLILVPDARHSFDLNNHSKIRARISDFFHRHLSQGTG